jgi:hypothetical protein
MMEGAAAAAVIRAVSTIRIGIRQKWGGGSKDSTTTSKTQVWKYWSLRVSSEASNQQLSFLSV